MKNRQEEVLSNSYGVHKSKFVILVQATPDAYAVVAVAVLNGEGKGGSK